MEAVDFRPSGVVLDLDGTLLDVGGRCSQAVRSAVSWASHRVPVIIATGREPDDTAHFARLLGLWMPQVCDNGARLVDPVTGRTLEQSPMPEASARWLISAISDLGLSFYAVDDGRMVQSAEAFRAWKVTIIVAHGVGEATARSCAKALTRDGITIELSTNPSGDYWYVNFVRDRIDKAVGVRRFAEMAGLDTSELMAIGDGLNDLSMFRVAGLGVAMGHAPAEVRSEAAYVTGTLAEDGVAEAIRRFVY